MSGFSTRRRRRFASWAGAPINWSERVRWAASTGRICLGSGKPSKRGWLVHARKLSKLERALALFLALAWVCGGCVAPDAALTHSRWLMAIVAVAAIAYGIAWARVAAFARLLSWSELVFPWRRRA